MPRRFTPSPLSEVKDAITAKGRDVFLVAGGLAFVLREGFPVHLEPDTLVREHGWAVAAIFENTEADEIAVIIMPITEVPE